MTTRLQKAIAMVQQLPKNKQDQYADLLIKVLNEKSDLIETLSLISRTPEERVKKLKAFAESFSGGADLSDEALRRINMYD